MKRRIAALAPLMALALAATSPSFAEQTAAAAGEVVRVEHHDPSTTPARGLANAPVTVELYFAPSINLGVRLAALRQLDLLLERHPTRVRVLYRVVQIQGAGPLLPTLALEAYAQGRFFPLLEALESQRERLTRERMLDLAASLGMDRVRTERAFSEARYGGVIQDNERRLERLRVGSPAALVVFNGRPLRGGKLSEGDYERAYLDAYERAQELLDRGVAPEDLSQAFATESLRRDQPLVVTIDPDDDSVALAGDHPLADPPLELAELPSLGAVDAPEATPIVLVCRPRDPRCIELLRGARSLHNKFRGEVRVVWAPWVDVARADAAEQTLLGDAALCAEQLGSSPHDLDASAGWIWVVETMSQVSRAHGRRIAPDRLIDAVARRLQIDPRRLSSCRARLANASLAWTTRAGRAGITTSPAVVIGGRIFHGLTDGVVIEQLVEAELAPGLLRRCATTGC